MNLCHVVNYTIYGHVKLEFQCYFKCIYLDLAVVNIVEGGIDMVDITCIYKGYYWLQMDLGQLTNFSGKNYIKRTFIYHNKALAKI